MLWPGAARPAVQTLG